MHRRFQLAIRRAEEDLDKEALALDSNKYKQPSGRRTSPTCAPGIHRSSSLLITSCIDGLSDGFNIQQSFIRFQILSFVMVSGRFGVPPLATLAITENIEHSWYGSFLVRVSYMTIPKDHISERVLLTRGLKVSGAIHLTGSMPPGVCFSIVCVTAVGPDTSKAV
jgi:hypothetical protein